MDDTPLKQGMVKPDVIAKLRADAKHLEAYFERVLTRLGNAPPRLVEAVRYSLLAGGKRLRPALVMEAARACGAVDATHASVLASAGAMELIHTFSLVHDDLPAMDDDDLRRGKPTNHKVFGEALAILAGDAMVSMAFELIARDADPQLVGPLVVELASATGPVGMIGGQVLDIESETLKLDLCGLQQIHRMKTGALLRSAVRMGAIASRAPEHQLAAVTEFGVQIGLAFQIVDDVLDVTSTPEQLGKATQKDAGRGKNTYPALIGLDASREAAAHHLKLALGALETFTGSADGLRGIARYVVERDV